MTEYEIYSKELLKLSPTTRFVYGKTDSDTLSHIENSLSEDYLKKIRVINYKFKDTKNIELKQSIENLDFYLKNQLYYLLFSSFSNFIIQFIYENENVYPKNSTYKKSREHDFEEYVETAIIRAKEGLKLKITYPKIIIKKFLHQIKDTKYKTLYNYIKTQYYPYCRSDIGICYIPNGQEIYKGIIREHLGFIKITPKEIHELGLQLIKKKVVQKNFYTSRRELFDDCLKYANYIFKHIIKKYFHYIPKKPFVIVPTPQELEKSSSLAYYDDLEKKVFITLSYYNECDKSSLYSLIMHECMHFYHFDYMNYFKIPKYKMFDYSNTALIEGFAHYMETYCENYDEHNNSYALLRKVRLVVDTGINYYGWTYKQALKFLNKYFPNNKTDNISEIDRYICFPGQSLSYTIGKLHIMELRDKYLKKYKTKSIKDFHHKLLMEGCASFTTIDNKLGV